MVSGRVAAGELRREHEVQLVDEAGADEVAEQRRAALAEEGAHAVVAAQRAHAVLERPAHVLTAPRAGRELGVRRRREHGDRGSPARASRPTSAGTAADG